MKIKINVPDEWNRHDYLVRKVIRSIINKYNKRVAKQISDYMGFPQDEILTIINIMKDNKESFLGDDK